MSKSNLFNDKKSQTIGKTGQQSSFGFFGIFELNSNKINYNNNNE
jgi:hypothetical protein